MKYSKQSKIKNKKKPKAIAMLGNNHCYTNAIDTIKKLSIKKSETVLIVMEDPSYMARGISWLNVIDDEWLDVIDISYRERKSIIGKLIYRYLKIYWALKAKRAIKSFDTANTKFYLSAHYDWESDISAYHSIENISKKYLIIDDGMKSIVMEAYREKELNRRYPNIFNQSAYRYLPFYERIIRRVLCALLRINTTSIKQLYWYTKLPISAFNQRNLDVFIDISEDYKKKPISEKTIHYISQPIPKLGVEKENYLRCLFEKLKSKESKSKIYYFPHRFEDEFQIKIAEDYFEIKKLKCGYEDYLNCLDSYPSAIVSFYSSVLFTLHKYHEGGIKFWAIYDINIYNNNRNLELVYSAIKRSKHVQLLNL